MDYKEFVKGENRYARLLKENPSRAKDLFNEAKQQAADRLETIKALGKSK
ncbi:MAG: B domain-containing protein [Mycoplasmoidaceae bacterium]|nr:B domain-containing protein [Mycoplasmoidaceae bacterium]